MNTEAGNGLPPSSIWRVGVMVARRALTPQTAVRIPHPQPNNKLPKGGQTKKAQCLKINIQKAVKCLSVLLVVAAITLATLSPAAHAASWTDNALPLGDFLEGCSYNSETGQYTYDFSFDSLTSWYGIAWRYLDDSYTVVAETSYHSFGAYLPPLSWDRFLLRFYPLGGRVSPDQPLYSGYTGKCIDVHDVTMGSDVMFHFTSVFDLEYYGSTLSWEAWGGFYLYDANGVYINRCYGLEEFTLDTGGRFDLNLEFTYNSMNGGKVRYLVPFFEFDMSTISGEPSGSSAGVNCSNFDFDISLDVNAVEADSALQHAINDKLGDINDQLGDLNDKQDQTNDKLDDIISGGEAGDNLNDALDPSSPFGDASGELDDAVGDFEDSSSKLPTTPDDPFGTDTPIPTSPVGPTDNNISDDVIPSGPETPTSASPDSVDDYVNIAGNFLDWENSGLTYMYAPMVLSVTLAIVFYTVFGKA